MEENTTLSRVSVEDYNSICNEVMEYMLQFESQDANIQQNYNLKRDHIHRVVEYTELLSKSIEVEQETIFTAQLAALLHDIGRFEQFKKYQTFNDLTSEDHAELGIKVIDEMKWLKSLNEEIQNTILAAISLHNKISIPKNTPEHIALIAKIIRDADKIDILDLAIKEYSTQNRNKNKSFALDLEISSNVSKLVAKSLMAEKLPEKKDLISTTDFKLMQMAYVYDLNLKESFSIVNKKGYLKKLFDTLPKTDQVFELYRKAKIFVENQLI